MMKKLSVLSLVASLSGCAASPTAATVASAFVPRHDNVPATMIGDPAGPVYWLCATQPRQYTRVDGTVLHEEDHYLQPAPCPATPISVVDR